MMSLPFLAAKLPLGSSIAVNYNEQSKIRQVTISKSSQADDSTQKYFATEMALFSSKVRNIIDIPVRLLIVTTRILSLYVILT